MILHDAMRRMHAALNIWVHLTQDTVCAHIMQLQLPAAAGCAGFGLCQRSLLHHGSRSLPRAAPMPAICDARCVSAASAAPQPSRRHEGASRRAEHAVCGATRRKSSSADAASDEVLLRFRNLRCLSCCDPNGDPIQDGRHMCMLIFCGCTVVLAD